jgi:uncharacterized protein with PIN domain
VKFVADGMLGSLSRWLRMMGHNVEYSTSFNDDKLLALAKEEGRVLLTRDLELYKRSTARGIDAFYVEGKEEDEGLAAIAGRFGISLEADLRSSRCPRCNTTIQKAAKTCIADKWRKTRFATMTNSGNAQNAEKSTGRALTGQRFSPLSKKQEPG